MKVRRMVLAGAAALAACGVLGMAPPAVQASSASDSTWTEQAPAIHPSPRRAAAMAYDAATGTVVLFGGLSRHHGELGDTWTWNGTTWTQQHPAVHPPARSFASMAYDAATGTVVLFGGNGRGAGDTWIWNGATWTQQHPAVHPPARSGASMAYDAATGTVVLFGGEHFYPRESRELADTWTWNGTTWTKLSPATSPPAREDAAMAYDTATSTVVLFGGFAPSLPGNDTWTWDGTTWTKQASATSPSGRSDVPMTYDTATSTNVLFGGCCNNHTGFFGDTWTWDGSAWTKLSPAISPPAREDAAMAYDTATSTVVLFGGYGVQHDPHYLADTWTLG